MQPYELTAEEKEAIVRIRVLDSIWRARRATMTEVQELRELQNTIGNRFRMLVQTLAECGMLLADIDRLTQKRDQTITEVDIHVVRFSLGKFSALQDLGPIQLRAVNLEILDYDQDIICDCCGCDCGDEDDNNDWADAA